MHTSSIALIWTFQCTAQQKSLEGWDASKPSVSHVSFSLDHASLAVHSADWLIS